LPCVDRFRAGDFPSKQTPSQDGLAPISRHPAAYVLLEIIIALTIFAVVVTGLAGLLHSTLDGANELRRQAAMRRGLESILVEAREKPKREEMALATRDDALGVEFRSALEEVKWINRKGQPVKGLWLLTASATDLRDGNTVRDRAEVYVYRP
jgi:type II secretory pathway pseudopilin PulG